MSDQILASELLMILSDQEQEDLTGGAGFKLTGSKFINRVGSLEGTASAGPDGSSANSKANLTAINTGAQDLLRLAAGSMPRVSALGAAPVVGGVNGAAPVMGGEESED